MIGRIQSRRVYIYRHARDGKRSSTFTLAYLRYQTANACVHDVEATDGESAKRAAIVEHRVICCDRLTP